MKNGLDVSLFYEARVCSKWLTIEHTDDCGSEKEKDDLDRDHMNPRRVIVSIHSDTRMISENNRYNVGNPATKSTYNAAPVLHNQQFTAAQ
jgi:hypothetical protein